MFVFSLPPYAKYNNWYQKRAARKMDYSGLTCAELFSLVEKQKLTLLNLKCSPTRPDKATITEAQKDIEDMLTTLSQATTTATSTTHTNTSHGLMMRQQSLWDAMRDIRTFNPGNNIHRFISDLNQAYTIKVKPELTNYPEMEEEFLKIAKRLLNRGIFQQMEDTSRHVDLRTTKIVSDSDSRQPDVQLPASQSGLGFAATGQWEVDRFCWPTQKHH